MKRLQVRPTECTHCRNCELACAFYHGSATAPQMGVTPVAIPGSVVGSRVIEVRRIRNVPLPMICLQCDDAACVKVCPTGAIERNEATGALVVGDKCIGCKACTYACPFGAMYFSEEQGEALKCDLCGGDPTCAKFCPTDALKWAE